jgi:hypothetical protein
MIKVELTKKKKLPSRWCLNYVTSRLKSEWINLSKINNRHKKINISVESNSKKEFYNIKETFLCIYNWLKTSKRRSIWINKVELRS